MRCLAPGRPVADAAPLPYLRGRNLGSHCAGSRHPDLEVTMQATLKHVENLTFVGKANTNHWMVMDGSRSGGGEEAASSPKELLLLALGGCTAFDVAGILKKRRVDVRAFELILDADVVEEHPKVFREVRVTYRLEGDIATAEVERAVRLSQEKYCSVSAMLRQAFPIRWSAVVNGEVVATGVEERGARESVA
jgi:putative redox protein